MWSVKKVFPRIALSFLTAFIVGVFAAGCASTHSPEEEARARAAAIGTWEYRVDGVAALHRGEFQITTENGRLRAQIRDERRGRFVARVKLNGSRMQLALENLRISGRIEDGSFTGTLYRPTWDVTTSSRSRRSSQTRSASLVAQRIASSPVVERSLPFDCPSILWETDDGCE